ncbi:MAG: peptidylprolyl isomerase [Bacteroidota bacterium]
MKLTIQVFWIVLIASSMFVACKGSKQMADAPKSSAGNTSPSTEAPALLSFAEGVVTQSEFERVYAKNNGGREIAATHTPEQLKEYMDLYINFKRKVFEAESQALHETPAFKQEFSTYRKQLAQPYLSAKEVEDQLIEEAFMRSGYLVSASHLLLTVPQDAAAEDTLAAYTRILELRDSIVNHGNDFGAMAEKYSQDPSAKNKGGMGYQGNLGYFSVFDMVYPFESAAFNTAPGEVSDPVRTQYGYHLVKTLDKMKTAGKKHAAHIIIRVGDRYSAKTEEQAVQKIQEIHQKLTAGESFASLASQFSDDPGSANKGGDLGSGRLLPEMEDLKLKLGEGAFSEPFQTRFGWHILQVSKVETLQTFEEAQPALKQKISRDSRAQVSRQALLNRIRKDNDFQLFTDMIDSLKAKVNNNFPRGNWQPDSADTELFAKPLFSMKDGFSRSVQDLIDYYKKNRIRKAKMSPQAAVQSVTDTYIERELIQYEEDRLPAKNPDFRYLLQEYRDGILLFTLMEQKVWKKAMEDTTGLEAYYIANQDSFRANDRLEVKEYRTTSEEVINQVKEMLAEGQGEKSIDSVINQASKLNLRISTQMYEKGKDEIEDGVFSQEVGAATDIIQQGEFYKILVILDMFPAGIKSFDDAKSEAITRYQDYLEQQWLEELASKYPVKIDDDIFANLFK